MSARHVPFLQIRRTRDARPYQCEKENFRARDATEKMTGQKPAECCKEIDSFEEEICYDSEDEIV